ncbi:MAG: DUF4397 domain-containing protein [Nitriliruptor sp.]|nr:MAG: DUF4397 domain-containing protein [Nitriliruptor sp.]
MKNKFSIALAAAALAVVPATAALADGHDTAQVTIVHGVPGADGVDITADGAPLLEGVNFTDAATTDVPAGTYSIAVEADGEAAIGPVDLTFSEGGIYAVVAHLTEDGDLTATQFDVNDAEGISAFHTAAFPAVAIVAGGEIQADDLTNGNAAQIDAPAGTELPGVGVAAAGTTDLALEAGDVTIPADQRVLAFAVGSPDDETIQLVVEVVDITVEDEVDEEVDEEVEEEVEQPTHVDSGTGGLLNAGLPFWVAALMIMGALGIAAPAVATARRRS